MLDSLSAKVVSKRAEIETMTPDPLSDVLKKVRLGGAAFFDVEGVDPWVAEQPPREMVLPKVLPGANHLISYHVVTEGQCYATLDGGESFLVEAGEVVVFTRGDPHTMSSSPGMRAIRPALDGIEDNPLPYFVNFGGPGKPTVRLVCGFLACDAQLFNPLMENLPPVIKSGGAGEDAPWLAEFVRIAKSESKSQRMGCGGIVARLGELMFIEVLRRYIEALPKRSGWLAGLRDPFVGKALSLLHAAPARNWTIEELARDVGLSRSVLAERFNEMVGLPPIQYLTNWRMQVATGLLSHGAANIASIAAETGYASEAAFSRAFKKVVGMPPSQWRRSPYLTESSVGRR